MHSGGGSSFSCTSLFDISCFLRSCCYFVLSYVVVWNLKAQDQRIVTLRPRDGWGGAGLLGVTIRLDNYGGAEERLVRVLEVEPYSPAADCGLMDDGTDYLLGTTAVALETTDVLASVLHQHIDQIVELYVYNSETDLVRVVGLMPTYKWSNGRMGEGLLGAEVGTGYLHRLPEKCRHTIGQSVERTVQVLAGNSENSDGNDKPSDRSLSSNGAAGAGGGDGTASLTVTAPNMIQMEPHLEMEVLDDEDDHHESTSTNRGVGRDVVVDKDVMRSGATPRSPRSPRNVYSTRQPHQLGVPIPSKGTGKEAADAPPPPPSLEDDETDRDIRSRRAVSPYPVAERQGSLTSVSMSSEVAGKEYEQVEEAVGGHNSIITSSAGCGDDRDDGHDLDEDAVADMAMAEKIDQAAKELEKEGMMTEPNRDRGHNSGDKHKTENEDDKEDVSSEEGDEDLSSSEEEDHEEGSDDHQEEKNSPVLDASRPATPPPASDPDFPQAAPVVESEPPTENVATKKQVLEEVSATSLSPPPQIPKVETDVDKSNGNEEDGYDSHSYEDGDDDDDGGSYETDDEYTDEEETDDDDSPKKKRGFFW